MKNLIFLILLFVTSCALHTQKEKKAVNCPEIIPEDFYVEMESNPDALVLDTRIRSEYAEERIPGALFAGNRENLDQLTDTISKSTPVYIYCDYEDRSSTVCRIMKEEKEFSNVYILKGGFEMWKKVNLPVDKSQRQVF